MSSLYGKGALIANPTPPVYPTQPPPSSSFPFLSFPPNHHKLPFPFSLPSPIQSIPLRGGKDPAPHSAAAFCPSIKIHASCWISSIGLSFCFVPLLPSLPLLHPLSSPKSSLTNCTGIPPTHGRTDRQTDDTKGGC